MRGSITIAVASFGVNFCATAPRTSSVRCWMFASRVSATVLPGCSVAASLIETGWPIASRTTRRSPARPRSVRVQRVLEPRQALAFGADDAEHLARERALRIDAPHHRRALDFGDLQRHHRFGPRGRHRAREVDEAGVLGELFQDRRFALPEQRGELVGVRERVAHAVGVREDFARRFGDGEVDAVAVGDGSPRRDDRFGAHVLGAGDLAQRPCADHAQVCGTARCQHDQDDEGPEDVSGAALERGHAPSRPGRPGCRRRVQFRLRELRLRTPARRLRTAFRSTAAPSPGRLPLPRPSCRRSAGARRFLRAGRGFAGAGGGGRGRFRRPRIRRPRIRPVPSPCWRARSARRRPAPLPRPCRHAGSAASRLAQPPCLSGPRAPRRGCRPRAGSFRWPARHSGAGGLRRGRSDRPMPALSLSSPSWRVTIPIRAKATMRDPGATSDQAVEPAGLHHRPEARRRGPSAEPALARRRRRGASGGRVRRCAGAGAPGSACAPVRPRVPARTAGAAAAGGVMRAAPPRR